MARVVEQSRTPLPHRLSATRLAWLFPYCNRPGSQPPQYQLYFPLHPALRALSAQPGEKTRAARWREHAMNIARPYPYLMKELQNRAIND